MGDKILWTPSFLGEKLVATKISGFGTKKECDEARAF